MSRALCWAAHLCLSDTRANCPALKNMGHLNPMSTRAGDYPRKQARLTTVEMPRCRSHREQAVHAHLGPQPCPPLTVGHQVQADPPSADSTWSHGLSILVAPPILLPQSAHGPTLLSPLSPAVLPEMPQGNPQRGAGESVENAFGCRSQEGPEPGDIRGMAVP